MSYEGPAICEYCQRKQHCVWDGLVQTDGCPCACPNPRHLTGINGWDAVCGAIWNSTADFYSTNMRAHVTCPDCLALRPPFDRDHAW